MTFSPTEEQQKALASYAEWAGPQWKQSLNADWCRAGSRWPGEYSHLHMLRNHAGPKWLATYKLPSDPGVFNVGDDVHWGAGTDTKSGQVVRVTASTVHVQRYDTKLLNGPDSGEQDALSFEPGGFVGHTSGAQRHEFTLTDSFDSFTLRRTSGRFKLQGTSASGSMRSWGILFHGRKAHYDFNF